MHTQCGYERMLVEPTPERKLTSHAAEKTHFRDRADRGGGGRSREQPYCAVAEWVVNPDWG
jgi:hypothetical protein